MIGGVCDDGLENAFDSGSAMALTAIVAGC